MSWKTYHKLENRTILKRDLCKLCHREVVSVHLHVESSFCYSKTFLPTYSMNFPWMLCKIIRNCHSRAIPELKSVEKL